MRSLLVFFFFCATVFADNYRLCVPEKSYDACTQIASGPDMQLTCVKARDRVACLELIQSHGADFMQVDPEDMYVAARMQDQNFKVFSEMRSKVNLNNDHRYEAVAVVHNSLTLNKIEELTGRNSCHTGIGRTVGYKVPVTKLAQLHVLEALTDAELTPRENELRALSRAFDKACIVGKWAPDADTNRRLKAAYSDLCALCENPTVCDYPDKYAGYEGALKCLNENGGDVAWTKYVVAKDFFGLAEGKPAQADPTKFSFLCPDASKKPATGAPCSWAARPWQGYLTNDDVTKIPGMRKQIKSAESAEEKLLTLAFGLNSNLTAVAREPIAPQDFLANSRYNDVIERVAGSPDNVIRLCTAQVDNDKCKKLAEVAYSRDIRPRFACVVSADCVATVKADEADVAFTDAAQSYTASRTSDLHAIMSENYEGREAWFHDVAVVKKDSNINSISDLNGHSACFAAMQSQGSLDTSSLDLASQALLEKNLVTAPTPCSSQILLKSFFTAGVCMCDPSNAETSTGCPSQLATCTANSQPLRRTMQCLKLGNDVAFVRAGAILMLADGKEEFGSVEDYKLLCRDGTTAPVSDFAKCYIAKVAPRAIVVNNHKRDARVEEMRMAFLDLSNFANKKSDVFKVFGKFDSTPVYESIFTNWANNLVMVDPDQSIQRDFDTLLDRFYAQCPK